MATRASSAGLACRGLARAGAVAAGLVGVSLVGVSPALVGCSTPVIVERPPVAAPRVASSVRVLEGSPLSGGEVDSDISSVGSRNEVRRADPSESLQVVVSFVALDKIPEGVATPLADHMRLLISTSGDRAVVGAAQLLAGSVAEIVSDVPSAVGRLESRANRFADQRAALPRGVTASFLLTRDRTAGARGEGLRESVALHVARRVRRGAPPKPATDADELELGVEVVAPATGALEGRDEMALVDVRALGSGEGFVTIVRSPFSGDEARAIAAVVTVLAPPAEDAPGARAHREACALATADLAGEAALRRELSALAPQGSGPISWTATAGLPRPDLGAAKLALSAEGSRRGALFALSQATGAPLAEDLALSGDDAALAGACSSVARAVTAPEAAASGPELGWTVERSTLEGLRDFVAEGPVPPPIEVLLRRRAGGAGRSCALLYGLTEGSHSLADFEERLRVENRELLEDGSPALRADAFDWLRARGAAPAGYLPLAPAEERRAALDRAATAEGKRGTP